MTIVFIILRLLKKSQVNHNTKKSVLFFLLIFTLFSCTSIRKIIYFQQPAANQPKTVSADTVYKPFELRIAPNDVLSISVFTFNTDAFSYLTQIGPLPPDNRSNYERGYYVDKDGFIEVPLIGSVKVAGLTMMEIKDTLTNRLKEYMDSPIVSVKCLSFKVSVLGEVNKPGQYTIASERITFPEMLALAGDLTVYGVRTNVKVIRNVGGTPKIFTIDLTTMQALAPDYVYVYPNDVIYVEQVRRKNFVSEAPVISIFVSVVSTSVVLLSFLLANKKL